ncbi:uncharacterized protein IL334_002238 [Kwoniella shivajii]|uniref:Uncharacterized protein n=1 Tax=Kwoniella shivajii TaxID=564305 RepID=A0ABZ1CUG3_9TREE|nr:hypothetical protein IL334_002238 [Kwoniella shivajii]
MRNAVVLLSSILALSISGAAVPLQIRCPGLSVLDDSTILSPSGSIDGSGNGNGNPVASGNGNPSATGNGNPSAVGNGNDNVNPSAKGNGDGE